MNILVLNIFKYNDFIFKIFYLIFNFLKNKNFIKTSITILFIFTPFRMSEKISLKESILNLNKIFHKDYRFICESLKTIYLERKFDSNVIFLF